MDVGHILFPWPICSPIRELNVSFYLSESSLYQFIKRLDEMACFAAA